jgi:tetraacyldisaccharide 4'-kinase
VKGLEVGEESVAVPPVTDARAPGLLRGRRSRWLWSVACSDRRGFGLAVARAGLTALSGLYAGALYGYRGLLRVGALPIAQVDAPVISIGNLALGGTGKTSATAAICRALLAAGARPAILSRGHGRPSPQPGVTTVSRGAGPVVDWRRAGDEPYLLASELPGALVLVAKDRRRAAAEAMAAGASVLVLDDGFQYWRLRKDLEIALVDCLDPFGGGRLFPRGCLREPISHLRRAHAIWLTHADLVTAARREAIQAELRRLHPDAPQLLTRHVPVGLAGWPGGEEIGVDALRGRRVCALSSIGNPASFESLLASMGAHVVAARFPDHYRFGEHDVKQVVGAMRGQAEILVTTQKDQVRLPAPAAGASGAMDLAGETPIWVLRVEICRLDGSPVLPEREPPTDGNWAGWVAASCGGYI